MRINKELIAKIGSLLIIALLFILLNYIITVVIGKSLSKNILQDEQIRSMVKLIKDSNVDYHKIGIVMGSETPQPLFSFYIFAFVLSAVIVSIYSFLMTVMKKLFHL